MGALFHELVSELSNKNGSHIFSINYFIIIKNVIYQYIPLEASKSGKNSISASCKDVQELLASSTGLTNLCIANFSGV